MQSLLPSHPVTVCSLTPSPRSFSVFPELLQNREAHEVDEMDRAGHLLIIPQPIQTPRAAREVLHPSCVSALTSPFLGGCSLLLPFDFSVLRKVFLRLSSSVSTEMGELDFLSSTRLVRVLVGPEKVRRNLSGLQSPGCCMSNMELGANVPSRSGLMSKGPWPAKASEMKSRKDLIDLENVGIRELHLPELYL